MAEQSQIESPPSELSRRRRKARRIVVICLLAASAGSLIGWLLSYAYNNVSLTSDKAFARSLDTAIESSRKWVELNRERIIAKKNVALIRMLQDIDTMHADALYSGIVEAFMTGPARPDLWKRLLDPDWPVIGSVLNEAIDRDYIDNKWILYAIAPEYANVTPQQIGLFDPDRRQERQLTHQLWALVHLARTRDTDKKLDSLIEHLCDRITKSQRFDIAVVDLYIQKTAFVLKAGHPKKVRRRWIERIIANQRSDGGWNDKWLFLTSARRPSLRRSPSNQHATVQALWLLYQVKYRYARQFALPD